MQSAALNPTFLAFWKVEPLKQLLFPGLKMSSRAFSAEKGRFEWASRLKVQAVGKWEETSCESERLKKGVCTVDGGSRCFISCTQTAPSCSDFCHIPSVFPKHTQAHLICPATTNDILRSVLIFLPECSRNSPPLLFTKFTLILSCSARTAVIRLDTSSLWPLSQYSKSELVQCDKSRRWCTCKCKC